MWNSLFAEFSEWNEQSPECIHTTQLRHWAFSEAGEPDGAHSICPPGLITARSTYWTDFIANHVSGSRVRLISPALQQV